MNTPEILNWVRATSKIPLALPLRFRRKWLYKSPVLHDDLGVLLDYDSSNTNLGVSLVLHWRLQSPIHYSEVLAKQAMWFIKGLCERTDLRDEKIPLRFGITKQIRETVLPYLKAASFPESHIDWIDSQEAAYMQSTKLVHLQHYNFKRVDRILHLDLCFLIEKDSLQYKAELFRKIQDIWQIEPFSLHHPYIMSEALGNRNIYGTRNSDQFNNQWGADVAPEKHFLWKQMAQYLNKDAPSVKDYFLRQEPEIAHISGSCFGFSQDELSRLSLETDIFPIMLVSTDEVALEAYAYREGWTNSEVCNIETAFRWVAPEATIEPNQEHGFRYGHEIMIQDAWWSQYK